MDIQVFLILFFIVIVLSLYDLKFRVVPNWVTLPLMCIGVVIGFPGNIALWIGSIVLLHAWTSGALGGGDAKLWIGLMWCLSSVDGGKLLLIMFGTLMVTGLAQILVRLISKRKIETGVKMAGAWRTVIFLGLLAYLT